MADDQLRVYKFFDVVAEGNRIPGTNTFVNVPKARSGHRMVTDGEGNLYSFGGYNPGVDRDEVDDPTGPHNGIFQELWKFNRTTLTWKKLKTSGDPPVHLASHCAILVDNCLIVYGGTGVPFGANCSNEIHICCLQTLEWRNVVPETRFKPLEQYGQAIAYSERENALYTIGGTTGYYYTIDVHKFDFRKKVWTVEWKKAGSTGPEERYRHEVVLYKEDIYVFGGGTAEVCFDFRKIPVYRTALRDWDVIITKSATGDRNGYPQRRRCHGCVNIDNQVFIVGGLRNLPGSNSVLDDLWKLDLDTYQWTMLPHSMPIPAYFHSASVSSSGLLTIFGGVIDAVTNTRINKLSAAWLKLPSLQELAWDRVLKTYGRNYLCQLPVDYLLSLGIPVSYVRRLKDLNPGENLSDYIRFPQAY